MFPLLYYKGTRKSDIEHAFVYYNNPSSRNPLQRVEILDIGRGFSLKRKFVSSITALVLIFSLAVTATALSSKTEIKAYLNHGIQILLNGQPWQPAQSPITYQGSTYLPLRAVGEALGVQITWNGATQTVGISTATTKSTAENYDVILEFPADKYPTVAAHIASAILAGESAVCTIDRAGADQRREASLAGIPTRDGYDRDEWPMAMCEEGGSGASVAYIDPTENRGAGSWVGNSLEKYPDGTRVKFVVTFGELDADAKRTTNGSSGVSGQSMQFASCAEARAAGAAPLYRGDPGYSERLDRDGDGIACE